MCKRDEAYSLDTGEIEAIKVNQDIIRRMANNSDRVKSLFVTLVGVGVTLLGTDNVCFTLPVAIGYSFVAAVLWYMDSRYLRLEQQFRKHHDAIVDGTVTVLGQWRYDLTKYNVSWRKAFFSFSTWIYPIFIIGIFVVYICTNYFPAR